MTTCILWYNLAVNRVMMALTPRSRNGPRRPVTVPQKIKISKSEVSER